MELFYHVPLRLFVILHPAHTIVMPCPWHHAPQRHALAHLRNVKPRIKRVAVPEHVGHQEVEQGPAKPIISTATSTRTRTHSPELVQVVLERSARQQQAICDTKLTDDYSEPGRLVLDSMRLINHEELPRRCPNTRIISCAQARAHPAHHRRRACAREPSTQTLTVRSSQ
jgi:hypothetical protein